MIGRICKVTIVLVFHGKIVSAHQNQGVFHGKMDRGYEKERFESLSIKASIAKKFRRFCKKCSKSQSMTLLQMIDFFEINEVSPNDRLGETISSLRSQMKRRFNAVIAIIRDIEKSQTKPTTAMLYKLFEEAAHQEEEEVYDFGTPSLITENEELVYYRMANSKMKEKFQSMVSAFEQLLDKTNFVKNSFGSSYYKLEITKEEFDTLKQKLEDVYNDNATEIG